MIENLHLRVNSMEYSHIGGLQPVILIKSQPLTTNHQSRMRDTSSVYVYYNYQRRNTHFFVIFRN